jgi:8-oxo-dGTP diphosphatase
MSVSERSEEWVTDQLSRLTDEYGSAPVHQLSWTIPEERYDRAADVEATEHAAAGVRVTNDTDEILLVRDRHNEWACPRGPVNPDESLEDGAIRNVQKETGITCTVEGIERITIASVSDESDRDRPPIYCLIVLFVGSCGPDEHVECSNGPVRWRSARPTDRLDAGVLAL